MCPATVATFSRRMRQARATAPPPITMEREAKVPMPKGLRLLSPWRTVMRSGSMVSSSCATCDSVVSSPCP